MDKETRYEKINVFQWLLIHRTFLVGQWLQQSSGPTACIYCSCQMETLKHYLWECKATKQDWRRVFRILTFMCRDGGFSWGMCYNSTNVVAI